MRLAGTVLLFTLLPLLPAQAGNEKDVLAAVQRIFDGMGAHDAAMIRSVLLPEARLYSARGDTAPTAMPAEEFASRIAAVKGELKERFIGTPTVSIHGRIAHVWGDYEFLRDGKFYHCGVDSFSLLKTAEGWKVAAIADTQETAGCPGH